MGIEGPINVRLGRRVMSHVIIEEDNRPEYLLPSNGGKQNKKGMYEDENGNNLGEDYEARPPGLSPDASDQEPIE